MESGALPFELLACLLGFFMRRMRLAERAVLLQLELVRHGLLVLGCGIVPLLATLAGQRDGVSHILRPSESSRDEPGCW